MRGTLMFLGLLWTIALKKEHFSQPWHHRCMPTQLTNLIAVLQMIVILSIKDFSNFSCCHARSVRFYLLCYILPTSVPVYEAKSHVSVCCQSPLPKTLSQKLKSGTDYMHGRFRAETSLNKCHQNHSLCSLLKQ